MGKASRYDLFSIFFLTRTIFWTIFAILARIFQKINKCFEFDVTLCGVSNALYNLYAFIQTAIQFLSILLFCGFDITDPIHQSQSSIHFFGSSTQNIGVATCFQKSRNYLQVV